MIATLSQDATARGSHLPGPLRRSLGLVVALLAATGASSAHVSLFPDALGTINADATRLAVADLDSDGHMDVVAGRGSVFLGNGDGTFREPRRYDVASLYGAVVVGDLNGDSIPDLIGAGRYNFGPEIALGRGDGTFQDTLRLWNEGNYSVVVVDLNNDGAQDLAAPLYGPNKLQVTLGRGDGTFETEGWIDVGLYPFTVVGSDLDRDGNIDLAVTNYKAAEGEAGDLSILLGRGDGTFDAETRIDLGGCYARRAAIADFTRDGIADLVVGCGGGGRSALVLPGNGDGTFRPPSAELPAYDVDMVVADVNLDGDADLVTAGGRLGIFLGRGDGTFQEVGSGRPARSVAVADFDGDGRPDLAVDQGGSVIALLGDGAGGFHPLPEEHRRYRVGRWPLAMVAGDLDEDGFLDLLTANSLSDDISILMGLEGGAFAPELRVGAGIRPHGMALGDFDGDGRLDAAVTNDGSEDVSILLGTGDGGFDAQPPVPVPLPRRPVTADFNRDGRLDVALRSGLDRIVVLHGQGDGRLAPGPELQTGLAYELELSVADLDDDGLPELITGAEYEGLWIHPARGDGSFGAPSIIPESVSGRTIVVEDLDGDGKEDIAVGGGGGYLICPGAGDGTLQPCVSGTAGFPEIAADFDGNGFIDLAAHGRDGFFLGLNYGAAIFAPGRALPISFAAGKNTSGIVSGDFNRDGREDVAVVNRGSEDVSVFLNTGVVPNVPPRAAITGADEVDCVAGAGTVVLDARSSRDLNSTPGTNDDIVSYLWWSRYPFELMAEGPVLTVDAPLGRHRFTLEVVDAANERDLASIWVEVVDRAPPSLSVEPGRWVLWPPNHRMVEVTAAIAVEDACGSAQASLESVVSSEPDDAPGAGDGTTVDDIQGISPGTPDARFLLRAERDGSGDGRTYTVTYRATDDAGNTATMSFVVEVPRSLGGSARRGPP